MMQTEPNQTLHVLVIDDDQNIRKLLHHCLEQSGHQVIQAADSVQARAAIAQTPFDLVFLDLCLGGTSGLELIPEILQFHGNSRIVLITAYGSLDVGAQAIREGAFDYISKPFSPGQLDRLVRKVVELRAIEQKVHRLQEALTETSRIDPLTNNPLMRYQLDSARRAARLQTPILLRGEDGVGKKTLARAMHDWSERATRNFGIVVCGSQNEDLLEREIFGCADGGQTALWREHPGCLGVCDGGTILLQDIDQLPLPMQDRICQFLQTHDFQRLGDPASHSADVRIICSSTRNLKEAVLERTFREELRGHISLIDIVLPPLRCRPEDIVPLAEGLLVEEGLRKRRATPRLHPQAAELLLNYSWPGNLRELRQVIERAVLLTTGSEVTTDCLPNEMTENG